MLIIPAGPEHNISHIHDSFINREQPKCQEIVGRLSKLWCFQIVFYYIAIKWVSYKMEIIIPTV